jgi:hypothetical protein
MGFNSGLKGLIGISYNLIINNMEIPVALPIVMVYLEKKFALFTRRTSFRTS